MEAIKINISFMQRNCVMADIEEYLTDDKIKSAMMNLALDNIEFENVASISYELTSNEYDEAIDYMVIHDKSNEVICEVFAGEAQD